MLPPARVAKPRSSHRYLAMRRGWMEEELVLSVGGALPAAKPDDASPDGKKAPATVDPMLERLESTFDARFTGLESSIDARFAAVDQRFTGLETSMGSRFDAVDRRFDHLDRDVQAIARVVFPRD